MRYNGNSKEIKKAILSESMPYLMERLDRMSKLELAEIIERDNERDDQRRRYEDFYGSAIIVIELDGIEVQRLEIKENDYSTNIKDVFELYDNLKRMFIDLGVVNASLTFKESYSD
jgi:hypothetical protein